MSCADAHTRAFEMSTALLALLLIVSEFIGVSTCDCGSIVGFLYKMCCKMRRPPEIPCLLGDAARMSQDTQRPLRMSEELT